MAIFIISDTVFRVMSDGQTEVKTLMVPVEDTTTFERAYHLFVESFENSPEASSGWQLAGSPAVFEVTQGKLEEWKVFASNISSLTTVVQKNAPHLRVVR